jgi:hypothetical protein
MSIVQGKDLAKSEIERLLIDSSGNAAANN